MTAPLRRRVFRALWIASVASNVGTWMQEVGAAWLMTTLTPSPLSVTLIQAGSSLPMFLLAIPSGALADIVDRRRMLIATQTWMLAAAATLGVVTLTGHVTPAALLLVTFAMGFGVALNGPAWQAVVSELVPRDELPAAVALNSVGFNLARAVGPALGGLIVAAAGPGATFLFNAVSFLGTVFVLYGWDRRSTSTPLAAERLAGAMRGGLRYVRYQPGLRAVMVRAGGFMFFAIGLMALLPLIARGELGRGPMGYGVMLGCLGFGAVTGAAVLVASASASGPSASCRWAAWSSRSAASASRTCASSPPCARSCGSPATAGSCCSRASTSRRKAASPAGCWPVRSRSTCSRSPAAWRSAAPRGARSRRASALRGRSRSPRRV